MIFNNLLMKIATFYYSLILFFIVSNLSSQETLPIYQDYLSDNIYLIHPAAAGIGECGKIRLTARAQWLDVDNAPQLQTASFHAKVSDYSKAAYGFVFYNDKNGFHSQTALQATYAYHLSLDESNKFKQLSFGLSFSAVQNSVDQTSFSVSDPVVQQVIESNFYVNADFGLGYHVGGLSSYLTIKNIFLSAKNNLTSEFESLNLRNFIVGAGYFFGNEDKYQFEPSFMFQHKEQIEESILDVNFKVYKKFTKSQLWFALSYRKSFGSSTFEPGQYVSPILGINFNKTMFSYTYTKQMGDVVLSDGGFHQITLGFNVLCREKRLSSCPNINGILF